MSVWNCPQSECDKRQSAGRGVGEGERERPQLIALFRLHFIFGVFDYQPITFLVVYFDKWK